MQAEDEKVGKKNSILKIKVAENDVFYVLAMLTELLREIEEGALELEFAEENDELKDLSFKGLQEVIDSCVALLVHRLTSEAYARIVPFLSEHYDIECDFEHSALEEDGSVEKQIFVPENTLFHCIGKLLSFFGEIESKLEESQDQSSFLLDHEMIRTYLGKLKIEPIIKLLRELITRKRQSACEQFGNEQDIVLHIWT